MHKKFLCPFRFVGILLITLALESGISSLRAGTIADELEAFQSSWKSAESQGYRPCAMYQSNYFLPQGGALERFPNDKCIYCGWNSVGNRKRGERTAKNQPQLCPKETSQKQAELFESMKPELSAAALKFLGKSRAKLTFNSWPRYYQKALNKLNK